ncbi:MAG: tRNA (guanine37-N1)-methyltransferase [Thermoplasmata archaeon]|nr:tRNA (guanine37-N1)-methyltransferase [Thermoplasmata archaeon]
MKSAAVRAPRSEAEATRRRLLDLGVLRIDLEVARDGDDVLFPVAESCGPRLPTEPFEFRERQVRVADYAELLPADLRPMAPRAFDTIGDVVVVKVPADLAAHEAAIGDALLRFVGARAVFADLGVKDPYRVRSLRRIAGTGEALTQVAENGLKLWVDASKAYFSPRLAHERARVAALVRPGEHAVDLFAGVGPWAIQAARKGAVVDAIDLNPDAVALARRNVAAAGVSDQVRLWEGDARAVAAGLAPADRIHMNLPHGARQFLDVAARLAAPGCMVHHHEILPPGDVPARAEQLVAEFARLGRAATVAATRTVRNYSPQEAHVAFDVRLA